MFRAHEFVRSSHEVPSSRTPATDRRTGDRGGPAYDATRRSESSETTCQSAGSTVWPSNGLCSG